MAFTLVELLVAMAVMAMLLVLMLQVINGVLMSSRTQNQQMESTSNARLALDVLTGDLQNAVIGGNAAILVPDGSSSSSNLITLLTSRLQPSGSSPGNHRFLAVAYSTNSSNQIFRSYGSVDFTQSNLLQNITTYATNTPDTPLAQGILAIQIRALGDGTNSYGVSSSSSSNWATNNYNGWTPPVGYQALITRLPTFASGMTNRTHSLQVWIASVDSQNYKILTRSGNLTTALSSLSSPDPTTWRTNVDAAAIPAPAKSGIRILTKTIPIQ
jgi:type II secretory pathway pseudopilin PulG